MARKVDEASRKIAERALRNGIPIREVARIAKVSKSTVEAIKRQVDNAKKVIE